MIPTSPPSQMTRHLDFLQPFLLPQPQTSDWRPALLTDKFHKKEAWALIWASGVPRCICLLEEACLKDDVHGNVDGVTIRDGNIAENCIS